MKFLHAADLHLDTPFQGLTALPATLQQQIIAAPLRALQRLVDLALAQQVDFVLLVGDLFDQQAQSVQAQAALMTALEQLKAAEIPVVLSFGNHDFQPDLTVWRFPDNVHVLGAQVETVTLTTAQQERVAISGFSYAQRWITTPMAPAFPLKDQTVDYQIGMLHGQVGTAGDHYAPFNVTDLLAKHYDYWALGHIHQRQQLNAVPPIEYPGNIQGRQRHETGDKGCLIVTSQADHRLVPTFESLTDLSWADWTPTLSGELDRATLLAQLTDQLTALATNEQQLLTIQLPTSMQLTASANLALVQGALLTQLQTKLAATTIWPVALKLATLPTAPATFGVATATWEQAGQQVITAANIADLAGHLLDEPFLNQALLETLTPAQWQQRVMALLADQYQLTTTEADDAN
ncbi:phosphoesterase [Lactobacillus sp. CBA3605]|uniref:metallophosphoesterase family protein n=1 Tax=Lactobacillus sp. CBA3605 TaxID=2099788 RepID=UPI000CFE1A7E|nr:DNA repair exonuclease [Lactobacillus sp. CBA3605]AVK62355.1 phosphoesterase [Lactobacillus sp. CBA3605]